MTQPEVDAWLDVLGSSTLSRIISIQDLLTHANEDQMSAEDREICVRELKRLKERVH